MEASLKGKVAVVTGGTRGIGLACAEYLAASGATVAVIGRQAEQVEKGTALVSKKGNVRYHLVIYVFIDFCCLDNSI